ncbi:MAG: DUF1553 domain-containing protein, partial [Planctomycetaceae bacterium]|nr:DUF1553 domain-containing protein [Planctomycetaceae bacterium]
GHGGGNFVITAIRAQLVPPAGTIPAARFVRITNRGKGQILSLAEVQVFSDGRNVAVDGIATQHSTAFNGPPEYAIDGNTDGDYQKNSVTHTDTVDNPWWEVDLKNVVPVERVSIWNRTDNGLHTRLQNFSIELLDADRQIVWSEIVKDAPNPSADYSPSNVREITFQTAFADYHQSGFEPADVLSGKVGQNDGWAVGGQIQTAHELILVPAKPVTIEPGTQLRVVIEQNSVHTNHLLGRFRLSTTSDPAAIERSRVPVNLLAVVDQPRDDRSAEATAELAAWYRENTAPALATQRKQLATSTRELNDMKPETSVPILREITDKPRETSFQFRGNYLDKGPVVTAGLPSAFPDTAHRENVNRLEMARWLVSEHNPLTPRVLVNRYWETLFGRGIVITSEEFGSQGELPTHPLLLDWLASDVLESGWDTRKLLKQIVMSSTYRQSAAVTNEALRIDSDNRWLARGPRVRMSAEVVRDQALAAAGLLDRSMYGPPVKPPQPNLGLTAAFG